MIKNGAVGSHVYESEKDPGRTAENKIIEPSHACPEFPEKNK